MTRAIKLAERGLYTTDPNPRVGCVLVKKGSIIAQGWHTRTGTAHAEIAALNETDDAQGATAYVTLEPCSHFGKTPPCCDALIRAGISRVVVAMQDPNPLVVGTGLQRLRAAGINVDCGILEEDAKQLNRGFIKRMQCGRPFVTSKLAMSLDGRTAMASGASKWITSEQSRIDVHKLRAASSAVLTGINTVLADDPLMNARLGEGSDIEQPVRVVLDSGLKIPETASMLKLGGRTIILTCSGNEQKKQRLQQAGFEVYQLSATQERIDLHKVMAFFSQQQFNEIMVEAGAVLNGALLVENLVDEWLVYMAPVILGDQGRGLFNVPGMIVMKDKQQMELKEVRQIGPDLRLRFTLSGRKN